MLLPCPSCRRHVRAASDRCPFCDAPTRGPTLAPRAAGLLIASIVASGCGPAPAVTRETTPTTDNRNTAPAEPAPQPAPDVTQPEPVPDVTQPDERPVAPMYGGPPVRPAPRDPQNEEERPAAAYGGPPVRSPLLPE